MKKPASLFLAALMLFGMAGMFSACGAPADTPSTPGTTSTPPSESAGAEMNATKGCIIVQGYEWGPAIPKVVLEFPEDVTGVANDTFEVSFGSTKRTDRKSVV